MTAILQNMCIEKLDNIVNKNNNTYHRTIKMKSINLQKSTNTDFNIESNNEDLTFEAND